MRFTVKYTTATGDVLTRDFEASSPEELRSRVEAEGHFVLELKQTSSAFRRQKQLGAESLILFNQELLALLKAGIPLLQSLELLVGHGKDPLLRSSLEAVVVLLKEGMSYSEAMEQVGTFPAVYRANVVAGERSGTLPEVLNRWLAFQQFAQKSRQRITEALIYPAFLTFVLFLSLAVIFNFVLPRFSEIYAGSGMEMPEGTRILLAFGQFVRSTIWYQAGGAFAAILGLRYLVATEGGKRMSERILLGIPRLGTLYRMYHSSVFTRTLSVLLSGGMPVLQALEVIQRTSGSFRMKSKLLAVIEMVRAGSSLHLSLDQSRLLDPLAVEMTRVGEQSSALPEMLNHVSDFFDHEVEKATTAVTSLIGPILILSMAVIVLMLLLAVYVPLFNAGNVIH